MQQNEVIPMKVAQSIHHHYRGINAHFQSLL
jgi:hypothetical protein